MEKVSILEITSLAILGATGYKVYEKMGENPLPEGYSIPPDYMLIAVVLASFMTAFFLVLISISITLKDSRKMLKDIRKELKEAKEK